jgi:hypothetical protein
MVEKAVDLMDLFIHDLNIKELSSQVKKIG